MEGSRETGGLSIISSWVTEAQPWRMEVPTQSFPVSPPPTMTTFFPLAEMAKSSVSPMTFLVAAVRKSTA